MSDYDAAVVGAGNAGLTAAATLQRTFWQIAGMAKIAHHRRPHIDLDYHVKYAKAEPPGGERELAAQISESGRR